MDLYPSFPAICSLHLSNPPRHRAYRNPTRHWGRASQIDRRIKGFEVTVRDFLGSK